MNVLPVPPERADDSQTKNLGYAIDLLKLEIGLFWQRSLFFGGFIVAALIAYGTLAAKPESNSVLLTAVSCFGLICSVAWTLANRGSKYWFEFWLRRAKELDPQNALFPKEPSESDASERSSRQRERGWLSGRSFAVTKIAIALSDFAVLLWFALCLRSAAPTNWKDGLAAAFADWNATALIFLLGTLIYMVAMLTMTRTKVY